MKKLRIVLIIVLALYILSVPLYATNSSFDFNATNKNLKSGDTFKVTLKITSDTVLNATQFALDIDQDVFECENISLEDTSNFSLFNHTVDGVEVLSLTGTTEPLVLNFDFKVKDTNKSGNFEIAVKDLKVDYVEELDVFSYSVPSINFKVNSNSIFSLTNPYLYIGLFLIAVIIVIIIVFIKKAKK